MAVHLNLERTKCPEADDMALQGGNFTWTTVYGSAHEFALAATNTKDDANDCCVGINQTVRFSKREGTYEGANGVKVKSSLLPEAGISCMDGGNDEYGLRPWYSETCKAAELKKGANLERLLSDNPSAEYPRILCRTDDEEVRIHLSTLEIQETFVISVVVFKPDEKPADPADEDKWRPLVQEEWTWGYSYTVQAHKDGGGKSPTLVAGTSKPNYFDRLEPLTRVMKSKGLPANKGVSKFTTDTEGWKPYNWGPKD